MIQSPKTRFQEDKHAITKHFDLTATSDFQRAVDAALLQFMFTNRIPTSKVTTEQAAALYHKMAGAMDFVAALMTLADKPKPEERPKDDNLDWKV